MSLFCGIVGPFFVNTDPEMSGVEYILVCNHCHREVDLPGNFVGTELPCKSCGEVLDLSDFHHTASSVPIYSDKKIDITSRRVNLKDNNRTYRVRFIKDIWIKHEKPHRAAALVLAILGIIAIVGGLVGAMFDLDTTGYTLICFGILLLAFTYFVTLGYFYNLMMKVDRNEIKLLNSKSYPYMTKIRYKLKDAVKQFEKEH